MNQSPLSLFLLVSMGLHIAGAALFALISPQPKTIQPIQIVIANQNSARSAQVGQPSQPATSQPAPPKVVQPTTSQPKVSQPKVSQPKVSQPKVNQPVQQKTAQPKVIQPKVSQPKVNQPTTSQTGEKFVSQEQIAKSRQQVQQQRQQQRQQAKSDTPQEQPVREQLAQEQPTREQSQEQLAQQQRRQQQQKLSRELDDLLNSKTQRQADFLDGASWTGSPRRTVSFPDLLASIPKEYRDRGYGFSVTAKITFNQQGLVASIDLVQGSGDPRIDSVFRSELRKIRIEPKQGDARYDSITKTFTVSVK